MHKIVLGSDLRRLEQQAISEHGPDLAEEFMLNAGQGIFDILVASFGDDDSVGRVQLFCGTGNNAGDAYVVGRMLLEEGSAVTALQFGDLSEASELCQKMAKAFIDAGGELVREPDGMADILIDGILGTGVSGTLRGVQRDAVELINRIGATVVSIDIPSGLDADRGVIADSPVVRADLTITLGMPKFGLFVGGGLDYAGEITSVEFGLPSEATDALDSAWRLVPRNFGFQVLPPLARSQHKYDAGATLIVGGSEDMPGSGVLAARAALRSGAGLCWLANANPNISISLASDPEVIPQRVTEDYSALAGPLAKARSLVVGCGLGTSPVSRGLIEHLCRTANVPVVLDADALTCFADQKFGLPKQTIMTPHFGEMHRLMPELDPACSREYVEACHKWARDQGVILVLKGAPSFVVGGPGVFCCPYGDPGMATAGSGDVLAGMIGAFSASGLGVADAALAGVIEHQRAGEFCAAERGGRTMVARDIIEGIRLA